MTKHGDQRLRVVLEAHHLNFSGRLHGGMAMTLLLEAMNEAAAGLAHGASSPARATVLSLNFEFIGSAGLGATVDAQVSVTRAARTVLFLACRLVSDGQTLTAASAVYRIDPVADDPPLSNTPPAPVSTEGWDDLPVSVPHGRHIGPFYRRSDPGGQEVIGFVAEPFRLDNRGPVQVHDGALLTLADMFTGWAVYQAVTDRHAVTLTLQVRRFDGARQGEWVEFRAAPALPTPSVGFADGMFHSAGRPLMSVSSAWKFTGPR
ncbi:MAG: hotdog domain-containing protein [Burkholderiales bacterium]